MGKNCDTCKYFGKITRPSGDKTGICDKTDYLITQMKGSCKDYKSKKYARLLDKFEVVIDDMTDYSPNGWKPLQYYI